MAKKINGEELVSPKMKLVMKGLYEPFPQDKIESRKGRSGQTWSFVASSEVINRLNEVFGCSWSVTEVESMVVNNFVVKRVRLEIPDPDNPSRTAIRDGWGGHAIGNDPGDSMKSAFSKALTKAASLFGVGLHLWGVSSENVSGDTGDVPPWEGPNQFTSPNMGQSVPQMNVTVVNPGPHNSSNIPGGVMMPPMQAAPPQLTNPNVGMGQPQSQPMPPQQQYPPTGPVPQMSNPNVGYTQGPGTPAQTQVQFQAAPPQAGQQYVPPSQQPMAPPMGAPPMMQPPNQGGVGIAAHQVSAIRGASTMNGFPDPMILVRQVLGAEAQALQAVEELTHDQAVRVLEYVRQTQGV